MSDVTNRVVIRLTTNLNYRAAWVDHLGYERVLPRAAGASTYPLAVLAVQLWYPELFGDGVQFDPEPREPAGEKIVILQKTTNKNWRAYWIHPVSRQPCVLPLVAGIVSLQRAIELVSGRYLHVLGISKIGVIPDLEDAEFARMKEQSGIWFSPDYGVARKMPIVQPQMYETPDSEDVRV